jgi:hypothetical protein
MEHYTKVTSVEISNLMKASFVCFGVKEVSPWYHQPCCGFLFLGGYGTRIWGLNPLDMLVVRQVLYHFSHAPNLFVFMFLRPGLTLPFAWAGLELELLLPPLPPITEVTGIYHHTWPCYVC